jgi:hypothetical protein
MRKTSVKIAIGLIAVLGLTVSSANAATSKATPKPTAKASAKATVSTSAKASAAATPMAPSMPPVIIDPAKVRTATISINSALVFDLADETGIGANISNKKVAQFFAAGTQGTYTTHSGVRPIAVGTTYVVVQKYGAIVGVVKLTITN